MWTFLALLSSFCLPAYCAGPFGTLTIAGSGTCYPIEIAWQTSGFYANWTNYSVTVAQGGSGAGATDVCAPRTSSIHVDIGSMSRAWKTSEALLLDDGYTYECLNSKNRVTQVIIGVDGVAVVAAKNGLAGSCIVKMGGLTLAQLRWMFSTLTNAQLAAAGVNMASVLPNDNNNSIKEWSDLSKLCAQVPISPYMEGNQSGTISFFQGIVMPQSGEKFNYCPDPLAVDLVANSGTPASMKAWIQANRAKNPNCILYDYSDNDSRIQQWVLQDPNAITYYGFAYISPDQTAAPIANDMVLGSADTKQAKVEPTVFSITDGSYNVFRRYLFLNVDNTAWERAAPYLNFGFSEAGQAMVVDVGEVQDNVAVLAAQQVIVSQGGNAHADYISVAPTVCWNGTYLSAVPYLNQWGTPKVNYTCQLCIPGSAKSNNLPTNCDICTPGSITASPGLTHCTFCDMGYYAPAGSSSCFPCLKNTIAPSPGMGSCTACPAGFTTNSTGSIACDHCPVGTYRGMNDLSCVPCPVGMSTPYEGSTNITDCNCEAGSMLAHGADPRTGPCIPCAQGMTCARGSRYDHWATDGLITQNAGFWAQSTGTGFSVFGCYMTPKACPAGVPMTCASGRSSNSLSCTECNAYLTPADDGSCTPCRGGDSAPTAFAIIGVVLVLFFFYYMIDTEDKTKQTHSMLLVAISGGQMVTILQLLGVLDTMSLTIPEPLASVLQIMKLFAFDIQVLKLGCVTTLSTLQEYILKALLVLACLAVMLIIHVPYVLIRHRGRFMSRMPTLIGCLGTVFMVFFISTVSVILQPFQCIANPNGIRTVRNFPGIICWQGDANSDHAKMIGVGSGALLIPFSFWIWVLYVILVLPKKIASGNVNFIKCTSFLVFRFRAGAQWYAILFLTRNLAIALAPIFPDAVYQVLIMQAVLLLSLICVDYVQPWRLPLASYIETVIFTFMILVVTILVFFIQEPNAGDVATLCTVYALFCVFAVPLVVLYGICRHIWYRTMKPYRYFICHHKAAAGAAARLLKCTILQQKSLRSSSWDVFIDSDNLKDLDGLFDTVRSQIRHLVVLVTDEVLMRPWCVGEIVTAMANNVSVIPLYYPGVSRPSEEFIEDYGTLVPDISSLAEFGMPLIRVQECLRWFGGRARLQLDSAATPGAFNAVAIRLNTWHQDFKTEMNDGEIKVPAPPVPDDQKQTMILADVSKVEAMAVAETLKMYLLPYTEQDVNKVPHVLASGQDMPPGANRLIIICTKGVFEQLPVLKLVLQAVKRDCSVVPILADNNFKFPTAAVIEDLTPFAVQAVGDEAELVKAAIQAFFKDIAVVFNPQDYSATNALLMIKAQEVATRLMSKKLKSLSSRETIKVARATTVQNLEGGGHGTEAKPASDANGTHEIVETNKVSAEEKVSSM